MRHFTLDGWIGDPARDDDGAARSHLPRETSGRQRRVLGVRQKQMERRAKRLTAARQAMRLGVGLAMAGVVAAGYLVAAYRMASYVDETNLLTLTSHDGISTFIVQDARGTTLWRISASPARGASSFRYGEVPTGFRQDVPTPPALPRPLLKGEPVTLTAETPTIVKEHHCEATGPASALCGFYTQGPVRPLQPR
jgi:hypothetical protein